MLGKLIFTNRIVAKKLNMPEKQVSSVTDFFFKELQKEIKECNHSFIYIKGLGTFSLMLSKLRRTLKYYIPKARTASPSPKMQKSKEAIRKEVFEWFRILRMLKTRYKDNKKIRDEKKTGIIVDDSEG